MFLEWVPGPTPRTIYLQRVVEGEERERGGEGAETTYILHRPFFGVFKLKFNMYRKK